MTALLQKAIPQIVNGSERMSLDRLVEIVNLLQGVASDQSQRSARMFELDQKLSALEAKLSGAVAGATEAANSASDAAAEAAAQIMHDNLLLNGDFAVNQRAFAGGALAAGTYGFDRWKAGTGGCNVSLAGTVLTHTSGPLVQVIETPNLAGKVVTVSVESPSGSVTVDVDGVTGTITAGSGRRSVTLTVPTTSTGNVVLTLTAAGVTYGQVKLEVGNTATGYIARPALEALACGRYYRRLFGARTDLGMGFFQGTTHFYVPIFYYRMRAAPATVISAASTWRVLYANSAVSVSALSVAEANEQMSLIVATTVSALTAGTAGILQGGDGTGSACYVSLDAEL